jgi:general secretion pathway protein A
MYLDYWNLKKLPFENVADPSFFYISQSHEEALNRLLYASRMRKGAAMLTGDIGCGKTLISRVFWNKMREEGAEVSLLTTPPYRGSEFLQEVLYHMGIEHPPDSRMKLLQSLHKKMIYNMQQNKGTVIVVDEAQSLPEETFEEARLLLNLQNSHRFLLTLLLIGQPELKTKVKRMNAFDQKIHITFHLHPFGLVDTHRYIIFRERKAGFAQNIFTKEAIQQIHEYTRGLPRKINSVCDLILLNAFNKKRKIINPSIVESVIEDLE